MICLVCKGSGCILIVLPKMQWWDCPGCWGAGCSLLSTNKPTIKVKTKGIKNGKT